MNDSERFTAAEHEAACRLVIGAALAAISYAKPDDREAAQVAVLMKAIELLTKEKTK